MENLNSEIVRTFYVTKKIADELNKKLSLPTTEADEHTEVPEFTECIYCDGSCHGDCEGSCKASCASNCEGAAFF